MAYSDLCTLDSSEKFRPFNPRAVTHFVIHNCTNVCVYIYIYIYIYIYNVMLLLDTFYILEILTTYVHFFISFALHNVWSASLCDVSCNFWLSINTFYTVLGIFIIIELVKVHILLYKQWMFLNTSDFIGTWHSTKVTSTIITSQRKLQSTLCSTISCNYNA